MPRLLARTRHAPIEPRPNKVRKRETPGNIGCHEIRVGAVWKLRSHAEPAVVLIEITGTGNVFVVFRERAHRFSCVRVGTILRGCQACSIGPGLASRDGTKTIAGPHSPQAAGSIRLRPCPWPVNRISIQSETN